VQRVVVASSPDGLIMNALGAAFLIVAVVFTVGLPRRLALLPLLLSATYMTGEQLLQVGPANFTIPRVLVAVGLLRALARREHISGGMHAVDGLMLLWAAMLVGTSAFHPEEGWIFRSGIVWTEVGCYFVVRIFVQDLDDVQRVFRFMCVAMLPLAGLMLLEQWTGRNPFALLGADPTAQVREGNVRAAGPFAHPILAGTTGAVCLAMGLSLWQRSRRHALAGCAAGGAIVYAVMSSGPILSVFFLLLGAAAWVLRSHMRSIRWSLLLLLVALDMAMKAPVYFLIARIDLSGGSQGYYRAQLVHSAIEHFSEWWLVGTDYTRHWMASGVHANLRHADITNHILAMGVMGGLPLMLIFLAILAYSFRDVGRALRRHADAPTADRFCIWMLGALLFALLMTFLSISLFDQSVIFYCMLLACIQAVAYGTAIEDERSLAPSSTASLNERLQP
jgi:hypothetical protein